MTSPPLFWALALALIVVTLAVLLWPLVRRRAVEAPSDDTARTAIYRDQKRQLDEERAAGTLSEADHAAAVNELAQRLAVELDAPAGPRQAIHERTAWIAALAAVAVIPVGVILVYLAVGSPEALRETTAQRARPTDDQIVAMVERLAQKMKAEPGDPRGWRLLGRSYAALGRYAESADAYAQAVQRGGEDADVLADWAESLALARNRTVSGEPEAIAQRALARDPTNARALALLATAAFERRDFDTSLDYWRRLQARLPPGSEDAAQAAAAIAEVERVRGSGAVSKAPPAESRASASTGGVAGSIDIAPALAAQVKPGDTLFVFARATAGPRMPLAVWRTAADTFPKAFALDDSMSMAGGRKLSDAAGVVIEARITHSGDATPRTGDLTGRSDEVKPGAKDVRIVIDQTVP